MRGMVAKLKARGFDQSRALPFERGAQVGCSQCEALSINGVACHEQGCPNHVERIECFTCGFDFDGEPRALYGVSTCIRGGRRITRKVGTCPDCANPEPFED